MRTVSNKYLRKVSINLPIGGKQKKEILKRISYSIENYLAENPNATLLNIEERFGMPQEIAAAHVETLATPEILKKFRVRKIIATTLCAIAAIALLMWGIGLAITLIDVHQSNYGYGVMDSAVEIDNG